MEIDSRALKPVFKRGFLGMGVVLRGGCNEIQNVLVWVWFQERV